MSQKENKGWSCPKCGTVYSPEVKTCVKCSVNESKKGGKQVICG